MWDVALVVLQLACLVILVAAAMLSIGLPRSAKPRNEKSEQN
jgi:hypothetical protein